MSENAKVIFMNRIQPTETKFLWEPYIPRGKVTIVQGDPGEGKSTLMLQVAAAVSRGLDFPGMHTAVRAPGLVLYQNGEDGLSDTIRPRLDKAGADSSMIFFCDETEEALSVQSLNLVNTVMQMQPTLVILDPLQAYLGERVDMHRANEIRPLMRMLSELADKSGAAIVLIGHMNKMQGSKAIYRGLGSIDLTAAARSVLLVAHDPRQPDNKVVLQIKNSLRPMAPPCAFTMEKGRFKWLGTYDITENALLGGMTAQTEHPETMEERAKRFLGDHLAEPGKEVLQSKIMAAAVEECISDFALKRAKAALGIQSVKRGKLWYWVNTKFDTLPVSQSQRY